MKSKTFTRITKMLLLLGTFMVVGTKGWGQTIVNFPLTINNSPTEYTLGNGSCQILKTASGTVSYSSSNGAYVSGWDNGSGTKSWYTTSFNSSNLISLSVSFYYRASTTSGPRDFNLEYSLNNSTWTTLTNLTFSTTITQTPTIILPAECSNQTNLYLRIMMTSNISISNGVINPSASTYLKAFVVQGQTPTTPSQASNITFLAITPTTIEVGCSPGNGTNRMIKINKINSFTNPIDNYIPSSANSTYAGTGEQTVYFGSGNSVTVTVPNSYLEYNFRVYEYNYYPNDNVTNFNTSTVTDNPKQCLLETIINPSHNNIRLTTVDLTAQITTNQSGTISERGFCWKTSPGVTINDNPTIEPTDQNGIFSLPIEDLPRSTTIYYIGFVSNIAGTAQTVEGSFDNIPEFTGTGNWEDNTKWDVLQVPGLNFTYGSTSDKPAINGICTLNSNTTVNTLVISSTKQLNISPNFSLTVSSTLTNNGGTAGLKLLSTSGGTGSLMHNTANVNATIERYIAGTNNDLGAKAYHLVSVPINSATYLSGVWLDSYLFTYLENSNSWFNWDDPTGNVLNTNTGAMVYYSFGPSKTYSITGQLNNGTYAPAVAYSGSGKGYNLVPNPYPSAIDWNAVSGWTKTNISPTIYGFNPISKSYGSWTGSVSTESVTGIIPVGQAFFVVATGSPTLTMANNVRLHDSKAFLKSGETAPDVLHLIAAGNDAQNEIAIQFADNATANGGDDLDAVKFYSDMVVPQLSTFTATDPSLLSINALPYPEGNTEVPLHFDMDFSGDLTFTASGMESFENSTTIKLEDKQLNSLADLRANPVYSFSHTPTDSPERFVLHFGGVLGIDNPPTDKLSNITVSGNTVYMDYPASNSIMYAAVYDVQGKLINRVKLSNGGSDHICIQTDGIYILKLSLPTGTETQKIVVR